MKKDFLFCSQERKFKLEPMNQHMIKNIVTKSGPMFWNGNKVNEMKHIRPLLFHYPELQCPYLFDKHFFPSLVGWYKFHHPRLTGSEAQKGWPKCPRSHKLVAQPGSEPVGPGLGPVPFSRLNSFSVILGIMKNREQDTAWPGD